MGSVVAPMLVCALLALMRDVIENTNAALIQVLLVVGAASLGLRMAGCSPPVRRFLTLSLYVDGRVTLPCDGGHDVCPW